MVQPQRYARFDPSRDPYSPLIRNDSPRAANNPSNNHQTTTMRAMDSLQKTPRTTGRQWQIRRRWVGRLVVAVVLLFATPAMAESGDDAEDNSCDIRAVDGGVACVDADGERSWEVVHPAMWGELEAYLRGKAAEQPLEPVELAERAYYAWRADVFELDPELEQIVDRVRFPAPIVDLEAADDHLVVTVEDQLDELTDGQLPVTVDHGLDPDETRTVDLIHRPGTPSPGQLSWSIEDGADMFQAEWDARWRVEKADAPAEAIDLLRLARSIDTTNPFLSVELGRLLGEQGDDEAARRAFERAVETPNPVWRDMLAASTSLEQAGAPDKSDAAFDRGLELMRRAGISEERIVALVPMMTTLMMETGDDSPIHRALMAENPQEVDRLLSRYAHLVPYIESGDIAFEAVANWMTDQGEDGLAQKWQQLADENREYAQKLFSETIGEIDRAILVSFSIGLGLLLIVFLVGLRGGVARRQLRDRDPEADGSSWLLRLRFRDLVVPSLLFVALAALPFYFNPHVEVVDKISGAPLSTGQDGLASPQTLEWLESLSESPALDEVISTGMRELTALQTGEELPAKEPIIHHLVEAMYADAHHNQLELLRQGRMPDVVATAAAAHSRSPASERSSMSLALLLVPLLGLLVVLLVGSFIGAKAPGIARPILLVIPGGSRRLAPIGAVALVALIAALAAHAGLDSLLYEAGKPMHLEYFGLQSLDDYTPTPSRTWASATLAVVAIYQAAIITWDLRSLE